MEHLDCCPSCNSKLSIFIRKCKDFTVSQEYFNISQCSSCSLLYTNPRPSQAEIGRFYESDAYISHSNSDKGIINKVYKLIRAYSLRKKVGLLNVLSPKKGSTVLDIGCGTGEFLATCKKNGWKTIGIEPNLNAKNQAIDNWGLAIHSEAFLDSPEAHSLKPSVITMWHVLEHVHSLNHRLNQVNKILETNSHLIIAVPNPSSWDAGHYSDNWAAYDVPRHLYHFTPEVLINLLKKHQFEHIKSKPMPFDSFYVSMLSEKYLNSKGNLLKALLNGLKSNIHAGSKPEAYSSVIYLFRKI